MSKQRKILVDVFYLLVAQTGVKTYTEELCRQIADQATVHDYVVVPNYHHTVNNHFFRGRTSRFRNLLFQVHYLVWKQIRLPLLSFYHKADVILSPDYLSPLWKTKALKITVIHDAFFWDDRQNYNRLWLWFFTKSILLGLRGRSLVLTISQFSKARLELVLPKGQQYEVIYQGSRFSTHQQEASPTLEKYGLVENDYLLFLGVMEKRKNLTTLIRAFGLVVQQNPALSLKLVLAGQRGTRASSDDYPAVSALISELGLMGRVVLTGFIQKEEVIALYAKARCFVFPSANEGFGLPVLEAFSQKVPVIVAAQGALTEIGGDAVLTFDTFNAEDLRDKLLKVIGNKMLSEDLVAKGSQRLEQFGWDKFFVSLEKIISRHA